MRYPELFRLFGWLIVVSAAGLLLTPWRWHNKFATWVMPTLIRPMGLWLFMRPTGLGTWDLVVAAPWLKTGQLEATREVVELLTDSIGKQALRHFAPIQTVGGNGSANRRSGPKGVDACNWGVPAI
jgi:hypothetical protein